MTTEDAVRIVRECHRRFFDERSGMPPGVEHAALETVLAALEKAQAEVAACDGHGYLRDEIERLKREKTEIVGIVQRWQPAGSPPPWSAQMLVRWICQTLQGRAERAEAERDEARDQLRQAEILGDQAEQELEQAEAKVERAEAERDEARGEVVSWKERFLSVQEARKGDRAEIARLRLDLTEACRGGAVLARERNAAEAALAAEREAHQQDIFRLERLRAEAQERVERLREALEAACAGVCRLCEEATYPARPGKLRPGEWWHDVGSAQLACKAAAFRAALVSEVK